MKAIIILVLCALLLVVPAADAHRGIVQYCEQSRTVKASFEDWAPAMYPVTINGIQSFDGVGPRLLKAIAGEYGFVCAVYTGYSWDIVIRMVTDNFLDWTFGYKTGERVKAGIIYSNEVMKENVSLFAADSSQAQKPARLDDVRDCVVGKVTGNSLGNDTDGYFNNSANNVTMIEFDSLGEGVAAVLDGRARYLAHATLPTEFYIAEHGIAGLKEVLHLKGEGLYIMLAPNSPLVKYLTAINEIIDRMKANGEIDQLVRDVIKDYKIQHNIA